MGAVIITALDEVAWLLNLRGGDVDYNPVFISYVIVTPDSATLYVDSAKVHSSLTCCGLSTCSHRSHSCMRNQQHEISPSMCNDSPLSLPGTIRCNGAVLLSQVTSEVAEHLADSSVTVQPYDKVLEDVEAAAEAGTRIWMDPSQVSREDASAAKPHLKFSCIKTSKRSSRLDASSW